MNATELMGEKRYAEADAKMREAGKFRKDDIQVIKHSGLAVKVCSPFDVDQTTSRVNEQFPAGTSGGWQLDPEEGEVKCDEHKGLTHRVFRC